MKTRQISSEEELKDYLKSLETEIKRRIKQS